MIRWWKQRKMRWAVKRHRAIHGRDDPGLLVSPCVQWRLLMKTIGQRGHSLTDKRIVEDLDRRDTIVWPRLTR